MKKLSLSEIKIQSFTTSDMEETKVQGGFNSYRQCTGYQNCDTANPDDCTAAAFCSNAGCTLNCTYIC
ncbi:MAG: pinensin family lanthipeptide [Acidobacteriota bacterium]|nr:pinensin family lanthipeptide [Acidobacteriota bacterium]